MKVSRKGMNEHERRAASADFTHTHTHTNRLHKQILYIVVVVPSQLIVKCMQRTYVSCPLWLSSESPHIVIETAPSGRFDVQREIYFIVRFEFRLFTQLVFKCQRLKHVPKRSLMWQTHTHKYSHICSEIWDSFYVFLR